MGAGESSEATTSDGYAIYALYELDSEDFTKKRAILQLNNAEGTDKRVEPFQLIAGTSSDGYMNVLRCVSKTPRTGKFQLQLNQKEHDGKTSPLWEHYDTYRDHKAVKHNFIFGMSIEPSKRVKPHGRSIVDPMKQLSIYINYIFSAKCFPAAESLMQEFIDFYQNYGIYSPQEVLVVLDKYFAEGFEPSKEELGVALTISGYLSKCPLGGAPYCPNIMNILDGYIESLHGNDVPISDLTIQGIVLYLYLSLQAGYSYAPLRKVDDPKFRTILILRLIELASRFGGLKESSRKDLKSMVELDNPQLVYEMFDSMLSAKPHEYPEKPTDDDYCVVEMIISYDEVKDFLYGHPDYVKACSGTSRLDQDFLAWLWSTRDVFVNFSRKVIDIMQILMPLGQESASLPKSGAEITAWSYNKRMPLIPFALEFKKFHKCLSESKKNQAIAYINTYISQVLHRQAPDRDSNAKHEPDRQLLEEKKLKEEGLRHKLLELSKDKIEKNYQWTDAKRRMKSLQQQVEEHEKESHKTEDSITKQQEQSKNFEQAHKQGQEKAKEYSSQIETMKQDLEKLKGQEQAIRSTLSSDPPFHLIFLLGKPTDKRLWTQELDYIKTLVNERSHTFGDLYSLVTMSHDCQAFTGATEADIKFGDIRHPDSTIKTLNGAMAEVQKLLSVHRYYRPVLIFMLYNVEIDSRDAGMTKLEKMRDTNRDMLVFALGNSYTTVTRIADKGNAGCPFNDKYNLEYSKVVENESDVWGFLADLSSKLTLAFDTLQQVAKLRALGEGKQLHLRTLAELNKLQEEVNRSVQSHALLTQELNRLQAQQEANINILANLKRDLEGVRQEERNAADDLKLVEENIEGVFADMTVSSREVSEATSARADALAAQSYTSSIDELERSRVERLRSMMRSLELFHAKALAFEMRLEHALKELILHIKNGGCLPEEKKKAARVTRLVELTTLVPVTQPA